MNEPPRRFWRVLDTELDNLEGGWTKMLLDSVEDPTVKKSMELLRPAQLKLIEGFAGNTRTSGQYLHRVREHDERGALRAGKITVTAASLRAALSLRWRRGHRVGMAASLR